MDFGPNSQKFAPGFLIFFIIIADFQYQSISPQFLLQLAFEINYKFCIDFSKKMKTSAASGGSAPAPPTRPPLLTSPPLVDLDPPEKNSCGALVEGLVFHSFDLNYLNCFKQNKFEVSKQSLLLERNRGFCLT